jgi:hypothetical protein
MYRSFCGLIRPLCSKVMGKKGLKTVLWIRICFKEDSDPDPAFYIRIRIQGVKPMRINADPDPDPSHALKSQKVEFLHENTSPPIQVVSVTKYAKTTFSTSMVKGYCCYIVQYVLLW